MGTELALHLLKEHELVVWNRTPERAQTLVTAGARLADSPATAVAEAEIVVTCLFGPNTVRDIVLEPALIPAEIPWIDATTISPADAADFATQVPTYVHTPVIGTLTPARNQSLGVYVGGTDAQARARAAEIVKPWAAANLERLKIVDSAAKAASGKLLANLALAVTAEGLKEALVLGAANDIAPAEVLDMLSWTGLEFMRNMKAPFVLGERATAPGDFTVDAIAKDSQLMLDTAHPAELPAVAAALGSLKAQQAAGRGDHDFSAIFAGDGGGAGAGA
ncbi:3-hydroxyisobutyrate dehydrogenase [Corynebacterium caspium DSM 44850]|nr:3-hydroxyisobutyrate dehydrogenase [Corynebacterium caspium DSM 44850]